MEDGGAQEGSARPAVAKLSEPATSDTENSNAVWNCLFELVAEILDVHPLKKSPASQGNGIANACMLPRSSECSQL